jgi:hypothetical protein
LYDLQFDEKLLRVVHSPHGNNERLAQMMMARKVTTDSVLAKITSELDNQSGISQENFKKAKRG